MRSLSLKVASNEQPGEDIYSLLEKCFHWAHVNKNVVICDSGRRMNTVGIRMNTDCLLYIRPSNIANIHPQAFVCICVGHSFLMKQSWTTSFNLSFSFELGIVQLCFNIIARKCGPWLYLIWFINWLYLIVCTQTNLLKHFQNLHLIFSTLGVANVTVTMKSGFDSWKKYSYNLERLRFREEFGRP